ncbi:MAG: hypothetical protein ACTSVI_16025 [Promethearchaeota archaeon]
MYIENELKSKDKIKIECPICHSVQYIKTPPLNTFKPENGLITLGINGACGHSFQIFLDKSNSVRGYQKADIVISSELLEKEIQQGFEKQDDIKSGIQAHFTNEDDYLDQIEQVSVSGTKKEFLERLEKVKAKIIEIEFARLDGTISESDGQKAQIRLISLKRSLEGRLKAM